MCIMKKEYIKPEFIVSLVFLEHSIVSASILPGEDENNPLIIEEREIVSEKDWTFSYE